VLTLIVTVFVDALYITIQSYFRPPVLWNTWYFFSLIWVLIIFHFVVHDWYYDKIVELNVERKLVCLIYSSWFNFL
jgi:hypothetical protein